jgi:hypothetical protein
LQLVPPDAWPAGSVESKMSMWFYRCDDFPEREIPAEDIARISKVMCLGADKYGTFDWCKGRAYSEMVGAYLRHCQEERARIIDPESHEPARIHAHCRYLMLKYYNDLQIGIDDRPPIT